MKCSTKLTSCAGSHFVLEEVLIEHVGRVSLVFWVSHSIFIVGRMSRYGVHVPGLAAMGVCILFMQWLVCYLLMYMNDVHPHKHVSLTVFILQNLDEE
ncbi:hypothetical protein Peur_005529 [Populus x canadensis]